LADLFHQRAALRRNLRIVRGQCVEGFGSKEAYYPMLEAIGQLLREPDGSSVAQALIKRAPTWLIQFPSLVKPEQRDALQKEILGATRERMVREMCEVLEVMTAQDPLVLILEDLHWVDGSTLDLISALARRRGPAKLVLLATYRPADVIISQSPLRALKQDLLVHNLCDEIALERLEESDVAEYLNLHFPGAQFLTSLAKVVDRHSGGNALFMVGIFREMMKSELIAEVDGSWRLATFWRKNGVFGVPRVMPDRSGPCPSVRWCCPGLFRSPEGSFVSPGCRTALSTPPACQNSSHIDERVSNHPESDPPFHPCVSPIPAAV